MSIKSYQLLHSCTKTFENACSRWKTSNVTQGHRNCCIRWAIHHFLLAVCSNNNSILCHIYSLHDCLAVTLRSPLVSIRLLKLQSVRALWFTCKHHIVFNTCHISWGIWVDVSNSKTDLKIIQGPCHSIGHLQFRIQVPIAFHSNYVPILHH